MDAQRVNRSAAHAHACVADAASQWTPRTRPTPWAAATLLALAPFSAAQARAADTATTTLPQVLEQLRREIEAEPTTDPTPIDTVLQRHADSTGLSFDIATAGADGAAAPPPMQPAGVTAAEWQALRTYLGAASTMQDDVSESGNHHYTLLDLDEDGQRELLDTAYVGGTGLFTEIAVLRRDAARGFLAPPHPAADAEPATAAFSINGRGSDQSLYWLRIDGRSYAAYRDGDYFQDTLTLSRPLSPLPGERSSPRVLQVRYRYRHTLAPSPDPAQATPEDQDAARWLAQHPQLRAVAERELQRLGFDAQGRQRSPDPNARCPLPAGIEDPEERAQWPWRDAGHYTFDYVADLRLRHGSDCYSASIVAFRSSYLTSYAACCALWLYAAPGQQAVAVPLLSVRERAGVAVIAATPAQ
ncbi:hypothetical protein [Xanthomonas sp. SI]|uniref:hypothetical protein n=1 Tax=Xanthomonas sp. SI TaxID=2724123 RepID=UPI00163AB5CC|nr:hypothetical protein [Xanthomonas sp. SI]QNH11881.1 hypothetical protein HEP75_01303 [Xanthomonas sp. SI]